MSARKTESGGRGTGYYADAASPIASTPQRRPKAGAESPAASTLSPMHPATAAVLPKREGDETWTQALFSPVLKFIGVGEDEEPVGGLRRLLVQCSVRCLQGFVVFSQAPEPAPAVSTAPSLARLPNPSAVTPERGTGSSGATEVTFAVSTLEATSLRSPSGVVVAETVSRFGGTGVIAIDAPDAFDDERVHATPSSAVSPSTGASTESEDYEYELEEFNPYLFMKMLPDYSLVAPPVPRICLPRKDASSPPVTLVLDLDETLVHCSVEPIVGADLTFPVEFNGVNYTVFVRKRPHLHRFLEAIHDKFEVVVFTASQKVYADRLLNLLDPEGKYFRHRLFRDACLNVDGNFLKDLSVLGRDMRFTMLVDNSPHAFGYHIDNGIPIESWFEDPADTELLKLGSFLMTIQNVPDVRPALRRKFNVRAMVERAVPPQHSYYN